MHGALKRAMRVLDVGVLPWSKRIALTVMLAIGASMTPLDAARPSARTKPRKRPAARSSERRLVVKKWLVEGVRHLDRDVVQDITRPHVGKALTLTQMKAVARRIRDAYESRGYVMAYPYIPPQSFEDGVVTIKVIEGKIGKVKVENNWNYSEKLIRRFFAPALEEGIVHRPSLQRSLLVLNQFMDLGVQSVLDAKKNGDVDIVLKVKDRRPLHGLLDFDNFGARLVGENRVGAGAVAGNAVVDGDQLSIKYVFTVTDIGTDPFAFLNYSIPMGDHGSRLEMSYAHARTAIGAELAALGIEGDAEILGFRGVVPDTLSLTASTAWVAEMLVKQVKNTGLDRQFTISEDDVRSLGFGHRGTEFHGEGRTQFAHNVMVTQGLGKLLGGSEDGDIQTSRAAAGADNVFSKLTAESVLIQRLGSNTFALGRFNGQYSADPLMVPEQFALGGPDSVRGFEQGEFLGDVGYTFGAELRQLVLKSEESQLQVLAFIDHGSAHIEKPLVGEREKLSLTGAGVGVRAQLGRKVSARADIGFPVDPTSNNAGKKQKVAGQVSCRF